MTRAWPVPARVVLKDDRLFWTEKDLGRLIQPAPGMFEGFLSLADAPASRILSYARRWGVLRLCKHDFPAQHPPDYWPSCPVEAHACPYEILDNTNPEIPTHRADFHHCEPRGIHSEGKYVGRPWEPIEAWQMWARRAQATLALAAELKESKVPARRHWREAWGLEEVPDGPGYPRPPRTLDEGQSELIYCVNRCENGGAKIDHRSAVSVA